MRERFDRGAASAAWSIRRRATVLIATVMLCCTAVHPAEISAQPEPRPANVVPITVKTPRAGYNRLVVSVTVCAPGTDRCATIDDVMLDTGSTGLRLEASAVPSWLRLPGFVDSHGRPSGECVRFVHDAAWGPLYRTDLHLGGLVAADLPIQIIADDGQPQPGACPASTGQPTSNGTLGIGPHRFDCQGHCEQDPTAPGYFVGDAGVWIPVQGRVDATDRLPNPVPRLSAHNNGVVFDLASPPDAGAGTVEGTLTLGVGTTGDNQLGATRILRLDRTGRFTTWFNGMSYRDSIIDSGTEPNIVPDPGLPRCGTSPWAFCVKPEREFEAEMVGVDGVRSPVSFRVGDYEAVRQGGFGASAVVAEATKAASDGFVWGAPFFLGRRVVLVMDGQGVQGLRDVGPFYAFLPQ